MEEIELERYKSRLREAFERGFSDEYINLLIGNIHYLGWMNGRMEGWNDGWNDGRKEGWMEGWRKGRMESNTRI